MAKIVDQDKNDEIIDEEHYEWLLEQDEGRSPKTRNPYKKGGHSRTNPKV